MATLHGQGGRRDPMVRSVKIAELKNRLSYYLRRVQRGESILVCDRDRVIARIERVDPHAPGPESDAEWLDRLERGGVIRRGTGKLSRQGLPPPAARRGGRGGGPPPGGG